MPLALVFASLSSKPPVVLHVREDPLPKPADNEVLLHVLAASINPPNLFLSPENARWVPETL